MNCPPIWIISLLGLAYVVAGVAWFYMVWEGERVLGETDCFGRVYGAFVLAVGLFLSVGPFLL